MAQVLPSSPPPPPAPTIFFNLFARADRSRRRASLRRLARRKRRTARSAALCPFDVFAIFHPTARPPRPSAALRASGECPPIGPPRSRGRVPFLPFANADSRKAQASRSFHASRSLCFRRHKLSLVPGWRLSIRLLSRIGVCLPELRRLFFSKSRSITFSSLKPSETSGRASESRCCWLYIESAANSGTPKAP